MVPPKNLGLIRLAVQKAGVYIRYFYFLVRKIRYDTIRYDMRWYIYVSSKADGRA